ncbi:MAG: hypothetical protein JO031_09480, partial [Ktedonobacteraceae bacterium]|nr:hypothetical protein [Ktedonobacteraceae bacterium]
MPTSPIVLPGQDVLRAYVLGLSSAVLIMAFFGTMWSLWGSSIIRQGAASIVYYCAVALIFVILLVAGFLLMRTGRRLPQSTSPEDIA